MKCNNCEKPPRYVVAVQSTDFPTCEIHALMLASKLITEVFDAHIRWPGLNVEQVVSVRTLRQ